jgi:RNA polymerase sigma factor for flagellar operon FliA
MASAHAVYQMISNDAGEFADRDELILQELPQVHFIASRILERLPQQVDLGDLVQAGVIGLIDAYRNFDHTRNTQFKTFARFRIRGAILDSLRELDWGSRAVRRKARDISEATQKLQGILHRTPTDEELAAELQIDTEELQDLRTELNGLYLVGQEARSSFDGEGTHDLIDSAPSNWENPFELYAKAEERGKLVDAIAELSEREQLILSLYYREELTMKEVAEVVGIAISRVSQIHSAVLAKLRKTLTRTGAETARARKSA